MEITTSRVIDLTTIIIMEIKEEDLEGKGEEGIEEGRKERLCEG